MSAIAALCAATVITTALNLTEEIVSFIIALLLGIGGKDLINEIIKWLYEVGLLTETS